MKEVEQEVQRRRRTRRSSTSSPTSRTRWWRRTSARSGSSRSCSWRAGPPLNVGVTSGGDFFGGSQVALADVLGGQELHRSPPSRLREFRSYDGTYFNLGQRLHWGVSGVRQHAVLLRLALRPPAGLHPRGRLRHPAVHRGQLHRPVPARQVPPPRDLRRRLPPRASGSRTPSPSWRPRRAAEQAGHRLLPEQRHHRPAFGGAGRGDHALPRVRPALRPHVFAGRHASRPGVGGLLGRQHVRGRRPQVHPPGRAAACWPRRVRGFHSTGDNPDIFYFGGNMELRGYPYLSFVGQQGVLRQPGAAASRSSTSWRRRSGSSGPCAGPSTAGSAGAKLQGEQFQFGTSDPGSRTCPTPAT